MKEIWLHQGCTRCSCRVWSIARVFAILSILTRSLSTSVGARLSAFTGPVTHLIAASTTCSTLQLFHFDTKGTFHFLGSLKLPRLLKTTDLSSLLSPGHGKNFGYFSLFIHLGCALADCGVILRDKGFHILELVGHEAIYGGCIRVKRIILILYHMCSICLLRLELHVRIAGTHRCTDVISFEATLGSCKHHSLLLRGHVGLMQKDPTSCFRRKCHLSFPFKSLKQFRCTGYPSLAKLAILGL